MGQSFTSHFQDIKIDVLKEAHTLKELVEITHEDFLQKVEEVNSLRRSSIYSQGREIKFFVKKHSDTTFLWKQTVKIVCHRTNLSDSDENDVYIDEERLNVLLGSTASVSQSTKLLSLRQFLLAYKLISYHHTCMQKDDYDPLDDGNKMFLKLPLSPSMIIDQIMNETKSEVEECIICMERKPEVTLPCAHPYCLFCIEQWHVDNNTCPMCRAELGDTDESWVTPDIPDASEVNEEVEKALTNLTFSLPD